MCVLLTKYCVELQTEIFALVYGCASMHLHINCQRLHADPLYIHWNAD